MNDRYCHGMVAASKGFKKGNIYNHHLTDGYYNCDDLVEGLSAVSGAQSSNYSFCWCNPNFEWEKYTKKPDYSSTSLYLPYEYWTKQAELLETRNCNGLVTIVDMWKTMIKSY